MSQTGELADNHKGDDLLIPPSIWGEEVAIEAELVQEKLLGIKKEIAPCKPRIIGVTKYFGLDAIVNGYKAGLRDFGESRAIDAINKIESLPKEICNDVKFHFIGHLQTNKAKKVVEYFDYIHSVDSLKLAKAISEVACSLNKRERVLLQVNNANEEQKFGYTKDQLKLDFKELLSLESIEIVGLMNMAPFNATEGELRRLFSDLREFRDELQIEFGVSLPELSMGMSNDYQIAVECGATMIRIGRKLFK